MDATCPLGPTELTSPCLQCLSPWLAMSSPTSCPPAPGPVGPWSEVAFTGRSSLTTDLPWQTLGPARRQSRQPQPQGHSLPMALVEAARGEVTGKLALPFMGTACHRTALHTAGARLGGPRRLHGPDRTVRSLGGKRRHSPKFYCSTLSQ